ncbi:MAG TPA: MotA/TolQ/ExbB proton channel family protein [Symbiobacteriaceae bacterium]|nr:MotA/TolQ/ExbB proton channel family protein [Symbiobacteriaceae bacterium]
MDLATIIGAAAGVAVIALAMVRGGALMDFIDLNALAVTVGGTLAATLMHYPLPRLKAGLKALRTCLRRSRADETARMIDTLTGYAESARREGVLALEQEAELAEDRFLRKALQLLVDGTDADELRAILEADLAGLEARNKQNAGLFESMAQVAPGFGMLGTLIGLIQMLRRMEGTAALGMTMATALLATFYGVLLANLVFQPLAGKLKVTGAEEVLRRELIMEGVLAIQAGDTPNLLEEKLNSFLPPEQQTARRGAYRDEEE